MRMSELSLQLSGVFSTSASTAVSCWISKFWTRLCFSLTLSLTRAVSSQIFEMWDMSYFPTRSCLLLGEIDSEGDGLWPLPEAALLLAALRFAFPIAGTIQWPGFWISCLVPHLCCAGSAKWKDAGACKLETVCEHIYIHVHAYIKVLIYCTTWYIHITRTI